MMYKTVRHGENSLQYTILPQQDESVPVRPSSSGRRHRKKAKTAAVLAITIVVVGGVIGTAVLVPILLTSDLVSLPAAFQKFSVATMRRTHTGNRMEILAKKPPGWTSHHHPTVSTTPSSTSISTSTAQPVGTTTPAALTDSATTPIATTTVKDKMTVKYIPTPVVTIRPPTLAPTSRLPTTVRTTPEVAPTTEYHKMESDWTLPVNGKEPTKEVHNSVMLIVSDPGAPSATTPWYLRWTMYKDHEKLFIPIVGGAIVSLLVILLAVTWMKKRRSKRSRTVMEKMNTDVYPADKENLLTEPTGVSDEEQ